MAHVDRLRDLVHWLPVHQHAVGRAATKGLLNHRCAGQHQVQKLVALARGEAPAVGGTYGVLLRSLVLGLQGSARMRGREAIGP